MHKCQQRSGFFNSYLCGKVHSNCMVRCISATVRGRGLEISAEFLRRIAARCGRRNAAALPALRRHRQQAAGRLRSGHRGRPRGRAGHPRADQRGISGSRHPGRGVRLRECREQPCLGHRSDRRHPLLHLRHSALGHAGRADRRRRCGRRDDGAALHRRAVLRDRQGAWYEGPGGTRPLSTRARPRRLPMRRSAPRRRRCSRASGATPTTGWRRSVRLPRYGTDCYAYAMLAAGHVDLVVEVGPAVLRHRGADPDHRGGRRHDHDWDGGPAEEGGDDRRCRDAGAARGGDGSASRVRRQSAG